jgi:hypothetical protein
VDKTLLRATAVEAATKQASPTLAQRILSATPKEALDAAKKEGSQDAAKNDGSQSPK